MGNVKYYTDPATKLFNQKTNFVGGINQATTDDLVPENNEKNLVNFDLTYVGALKKRAGFISHTNLSELHKLNSNTDITNYPTLQTDKSKRALGMCNTEQGCFEWKDPVTRKQYIILLYQNQVYIKLAATSDISGNLSEYEDWQYVRMKKYNEETKEYSDFIQDASVDYDYIYFKENEDGPATRVEVPIFSDIYDENNERKTIVGADAWYEWLDKGLAKTYKIDGVAYGEKFYLATGYKLLVISNEDNTITAKQVTPIIPTTPEYNSIGGNLLSDDPDSAIKSSTGLALSVSGMIMSSIFENKRLKGGLVKHPINVKTITIRPNDSYSVYYRYKYQKQSQTDPNQWTNKSSEHNGWEQMTIDSTHDPIWELSLDQAGIYNVSIEITPASNMNTSTWTPTNAGAVEGYVYTTLEVKEVPSFVSEAEYSLHTCRRLLVFYDQLLAYYDTLDGNVLYISDIRRFDYFPLYYNLIIDTAEKDAITSINFYQNVLVVLTENNIFMIKGVNVEDFSVVSINRTIGCKYGWTAKVVGNYLYFMSKEGLFKLKSVYMTEDRLNVEEVDYKIKSLLNDKAVGYVAYTYKGNYCLVEQQPFDYNSNVEKLLLSQKVTVPAPNGLYSLENYEPSVIEPITPNIYDEDIISDLENCTNNEGVFTSINADSNENVVWVANTYNNSTLVERIKTFDNAVAGSTLEFDIVKTNAFNKLEIGTLNGTYTRVMLDVSDMINGKSYTVKFNIIDIDVEITTTQTERTSSGSVSKKFATYFTLRTDWTRKGNRVTCNHYLHIDRYGSLYIGTRNNTCKVGNSSQTFKSSAISQDTVSAQAGKDIKLGSTSHTISGDTFKITTTFPIAATLLNTYYASVVAEKSITSAGYNVVKTVATKVSFSIDSIMLTNVDEKVYAIKQTCMEQEYSGVVDEGWSCVGGIFQFTPAGAKAGVSDDVVSILSDHFTAVTKNGFGDDETICYGSDGVVRVRFDSVLGEDDATSLSNFLAWLAQEKPRIRLPLETFVYDIIDETYDSALKGILLVSGVDNGLKTNIPFQMTYTNINDERVILNVEDEVVINDAKSGYLDDLIIYGANNFENIVENIVIEVSRDGMVFSNEITSDEGKIFIYDPYLDAWTSYSGKYLNFNNVLILDNNIIATDRNTLTYLVYPYLRFLDKEIIKYNDGERYYYNENNEFVKVEDGVNYTTKLEEVWNSFGKPYHIKKFKELMLKVIDSKDGPTGLRVFANIDGIDKINPISYNIGVDDNTGEVYVREVANEEFIPTITKLNSGFILNQALLGDYDISLHKIRLLGKGKTIKYVIEQVDDKFFGILGYSTVYKEKKPSIKNYK